MTTNRSWPKSWRRRWHCSFQRSTQGFIQRNWRKPWEFAFKISDSYAKIKWGICI